MGNEKIEEAFFQILKNLGFDSDDPKKVAERYIEVLVEFNEQNQNIEEELERLFSAKFDSSMDELVIAKDIEVWMLCPHHLLPVKMKVHVGYLPNGKVLGLSKIPRVAKLLGKRPMLQEDYTVRLVESIYRNLNPVGVIVVVEGEHLCVKMRGIKDSDCVMKTSAIRGNFDDSIKQEFLKLIGG